MRISARAGGNARAHSAAAKTMDFKIACCMCGSLEIEEHRK
jgi:hypothetical protein